jgi:hypothetical protein
MPLVLPQPHHDSARTGAAFVALSYNFGDGSTREPGFHYGR